MPDTFEDIITDVNDLSTVLKKFLIFVGDEKIIVFDADMGTGKTTIIKHICLLLGSHDNFSSPTYSIVNEYVYPAGKIYHFDLYRLKSKSELYDIGFEEYLQSGERCFIEWPATAFDFLNDAYIEVKITVKENIRYIRASKIG